MAIFTFSTKTRKPEDEALVHDIKDHCDKTHKNFSGLVVELLRQHKETLDGR
jgi:hypothetical protein